MVLPGDGVFLLSRISPDCSLLPGGLPKATGSLLSSTWLYSSPLFPLPTFYQHHVLFNEFHELNGLISINELRLRFMHFTEQLDNLESIRHLALSWQFQKLSVIFPHKGYLSRDAVLLVTLCIINCCKLPVSFDLQARGLSICPLKGKNGQRIFLHLTMTKVQNGSEQGKMTQGGSPWRLFLT